MQVCIPIEFLPQGGGFYFLQSFENYITNIGWRVTRDVRDQYDVLFTNHWMTPKREILHSISHNPKVRIVQRIDGAAQDYGRDPEADIRQAEVNRFTDLTIFQSQYCRYSTRIKFPVIAQDGPVIYNPVDVNTFTPDGPRHNFPEPYQIAVVSWSTNPKKGATKIYEVAQNNPSIQFLLCGNYKNAPALSNLLQMGVLNRIALAVILRSCQAMLTFSENEACPNHVLEALASGLPVLYANSGAMAEVIGDCGLPVTVENFNVQFGKLKSNLTDLSAKSRKRALDHFHPEVIFPKYVQVIADATRRPTHQPLLFRTALAWASTLAKL
jgi:glycosyltransferase involved in cell wall biosynthesis